MIFLPCFNCKTITRTKLEGVFPYAIRRRGVAKSHKVIKGFRVDSFYKARVFGKAL